MKRETKAFLEILIHEIQEILKRPHLRTSQIEREISELLNSWIKQNNLHPEQVQVLGPFTSSNAGNNWNEVFLNPTYPTTTDYVSIWIEDKG